MLPKILKRRLFVAALVYSLTFLTFGIVRGFNLQSGQWWVLFLFIPVIVIASMVFYFKKVEPSIEEGFYTALTMVLFGFLLDLALGLLMALFIPDVLKDIFSFYATWQFWCNVALVFGLSMAVAYVLLLQKEWARQKRF